MKGTTLLVIVLTFAVASMAHIMTDASGQVFHKCIHDEPAHKATAHPIVMSVQGYPESAEKKGARELMALQNTQAIRIKADFSHLENDNTYSCYSVGQVITAYDSNGAGNQYTCKEADVLTTARKDRIKALVGWAVNKLQMWLEVIPVQGNLKLGNTLCGTSGGVSIPSNYTGAGAPMTDLVLFVTGRTTGLLGSTLAFASMCQKDQRGRAIAGHVNMGPNSLTANPTAANTEREQKVALHEIIHVLGMSADRFVEFLNPNTPGANVSYANPVIQTVLRSADSMTHNVTVMSTPKVQQWVRTHFGCNTLVGPEMENGGGSGTANSHWEGRLFANELMTGVTATYQPAVSGLTFAALEDSGWYKLSSNFMAEPLTFGYKQGCDFVTKRCNSWTSYGYTPCSLPVVSSDSTCTQDRLYKGYCPVGTFDCTIANKAAVCTNSWYQYFTNVNRGGQAIEDFCTYTKPYSNGLCTDTTVAASQVNGEMKCPSCRCMDSKLIQPAFQALTKSSAVCYNTTCVQLSDNSKVLMVKAANSWTQCPTAGGDHPMPGFTGTFTCPSAASFCTAQVNVDMGAWPTITNVSPNKGPQGGGTKVTISGSNFGPGTTVKIGDKNCDSPVVAADGGSLTCTTTDFGSKGTYWVSSVDAAGRGASLGNAFIAEATASSGNMISVSQILMALVVIVCSTLLL